MTPRLLWYCVCSELWIIRMTGAGSVDYSIGCLIWNKYLAFYDNLLRYVVCHSSNEFDATLYGFGITLYIYIFDLTLRETYRTQCSPFLQERNGSCEVKQLTLSEI